MNCPECGTPMREEHDRGYNGDVVQFVYLWKCKKCGYSHDESGGY